MITDQRPSVKLCSQYSTSACLEKMVEDGEAQAVVSPYGGMNDPYPTTVRRNHDAIGLPSLYIRSDAIDLHLSPSDAVHPCELCLLYIHLGANCPRNIWTSSATLTSTSSSQAAG